MALFLVTFVRKNAVCILSLKVKTESISLPSPNAAAVELAVMLPQPKHAAAHSGEGQNKQASGEDWQDEKWRTMIMSLEKESHIPAILAREPSSWLCHSMLNTVWTQRPSGLF